MQRYKLLIAYNGASFAGWQIQPNALSIQEAIEKALATLLKTPTRIHGSGRTDSGVHAKNQVAHFDYDGAIDLFRTQRSLNGILPYEIRILALEKAPQNFHARFDAKGKIYHYHLHLDPVLDPFKKPFSCHIKTPFDRALFEQAARHFIGKKDFYSFTNESTLLGGKRSSIRTIKRLDIIDEPGGLRLEFEGDGFLYKMVRNIVGTLLDVAAGKTPPDAIPQIMAARDRRAAGAAAAPQALFLMKVLYR